MKRYLVPLLLIALGWNLALGVATLAQTYPGQPWVGPPRLFLATVYGQPALPSTCSDTVPLYDRDVGSLAAVLDNGRYYVAIQDRQSGGKGYYMEHVGGQLVNIAETGKAVGPAFQIDVVKVGSLALVPGRLYYTARKPGDTTGPYPLVRECAMSDDERAARLQSILGDKLTRLIDRQRELQLELDRVNADIYQELVNRLQGSIGAALGPFVERIAALEQEADADQ